nr:hypothetical protein [Streptomyces sp. Termitarium-T10T-6]
MLISTPRALPAAAGLTRRIAAKASAGTEAWCQHAVYRPHSMFWPSRLQLPATPLVVRPPRLTAAPTQQPGPASAHPEIRRSELRALLDQLTHTPGGRPPIQGQGRV